MQGLKFSTENHEVTVTLWVLVFFVVCVNLSWSQSSAYWVSPYHQRHTDSLCTQKINISAAMLVKNVSTGIQRNSAFNPIYARLIKETRVPVKLPTYLATEKQSQPIYAVIQIAEKDRYEILLGFTDDCEGGNACRWGSVTGSEGETQFNSGYKIVKLKNNIKGYFKDTTCGAVCSDSKLYWVQNTFTYSVGIKAAKTSTLIKVANSAIASRR